MHQLLMRCYPQKATTRLLALNENNLKILRARNFVGLIYFDNVQHQNRRGWQISHIFRGV